MEKSGAIFSDYTTKIKTISRRTRYCKRKTDFAPDPQWWHPPN
jgi:hypothetical protein